MNPNGILHGWDQNLQRCALLCKHIQKEKCKAKVARRSKATLAPTYKGMKQQYGTGQHIQANFWFCADDIERCVKGNKSPWIIDWPQVRLS